MHPLLRAHNKKKLVYLHAVRGNSIRSTILSLTWSFSSPTPQCMLFDVFDSQVFGVEDLLWNETQLWERGSRFERNCVLAEG